MCRNLTETVFGSSIFMLSIYESETSFAKPLKPALETVLLMNQKTVQLFCLHCLPCTIKNCYVFIL